MLNELTCEVCSGGSFDKKLHVNETNSGDRY